MVMSAARSAAQSAWASLRRGARRITLPSSFMSPGDIGLFLRSARTDARINGLRSLVGNVTAFDDVYQSGDPWGSGDRRYHYQSRKYDILASMLPPGRFRHALDLGCGLGQFSSKLASRADRVLGIDISSRAVERAGEANAHVANLDFMQGDMLTLPEELDGRFDLVVINDTIYYLPPPIEDTVLKLVALRTARLLKPGAIMMLCNHYFFAGDPNSRLSRRIHDAFTWSPGLELRSEHRRPFYLISLLARPVRTPPDDRMQRVGAISGTG